MSAIPLGCAVEDCAVPRRRHEADHAYQVPDMVTVLARAAELKREIAQRRDYLHQINRCEHRPEWRQPGGLCGGCGKDDFAEMEKAA